MRFDTSCASDFVDDVTFARQRPEKACASQMQHRDGRRLISDVIAAGTRHLFGSRRLIETRRLLGTRRLLEVLRWFVARKSNCRPTI